MRKYLYTFSIFTLAVTSLMFILVGYWLFWPDNIVVVNQPMAQIDRQIYHRGEFVTYTLDYCKTRPMVGLVSKSLVNDIRITYTPIYSDLAVGCHKVNALVQIPDFAPNGNYYITISAEYKINPIRTYHVDLRTQGFKVE